MRRFLALLALVASLQTFTQPSRAETRVALVIGNGAYQNAPRLPNPPNDAADVTAALKRSGFETISGSDMDKAAMEDAAVRFARAARNADVAVFYYSGHAIQFAGVNYLAPVDIKLIDEADLHRMIRLDEIVADLEQAKNLQILVLDACRDNPLAAELKRSIGAARALPLQRGLAKIDTPQGMIVAYATQAGRTAEDGVGRNSPYTSSFLKHIEEQEEIGTIFRRVSTDVYEATNHSQLPELSLSLIGEFYLKGRLKLKVPLTAAPSADDPCGPAEAHWKSAETIGTAQAYKDHLSRFPNCSFAGLARARIEGLKSKMTMISPTEQQKNVGASSPLAETASHWGLIGRWSLDCSLPPDRHQGTVLAYQMTHRGGIVHRRDFGDANDENPVISANVSGDGMLNLRVSFPSLKQTREYGLMMQADGTMRSMYNRNEQNEYTIKDGTFTANGKPTPLFHKCKPTAP